ncbi:MAG: acyl-CoA reductase [Bacteroidales bacterium]
MVKSEMVSEALLLAGETLRAFLRNETVLGMFDFRDRIDERVQLAEAMNPWFTRQNILMSFKAWGEVLQPAAMKRWMGRYPSISDRIDPQTVAVVMAGNIPMVGFHDLCCVLLAGHKAMVKLSGHDEVLIPLLFEIMTEAHPELKNRVVFTTGTISGFDAVIATGSNNSARYFDYYFGKHPHIIRKNRNSIAVLDGRESFSNLDELCRDIFDYFGMGCRSVSALLVPKGYDFSNLIVLFDAWDHIGNHNKYRNNYDYQKSIFIINNLPFIDHRNILLLKNDNIQSPLAVLHYREYDDTSEVKGFIEQNRDTLQCVVCTNAIVENTVQFGKTQEPSLWDYADGVDTMEFLLDL